MRCVCVLWGREGGKEVGDMSHISVPQEDHVSTKSMACHRLRAWSSLDSGTSPGMRIVRRTGKRSKSLESCWHVIPPPPQSVRKIPGLDSSLVLLKTSWRITVFSQSLRASKYPCALLGSHILGLIYLVSWDHLV